MAPLAARIIDLVHSEAIKRVKKEKYSKSSLQGPKATKMKKNDRKKLKYWKTESRQPRPRGS